MIDLHTHLDLYPDALKILDRVNTVNKFTLAVTTSPRAWVATSEVFKKYSNIKVALGLHPEIVDQKFNELEFFLTLVHKTDFIGEIGIDGSERYLKTIQKQILVFDRAIGACEKAGGKIISIHSKEAAPEVLATIRKYSNCGTSILHWFSGSITDLKQAIEMKCYFSVNPLMIKYKKGKELVKIIPPELILPESDGPFVTISGKPVMPWEAMNICGPLSDLWNVPRIEAEHLIFENFKRLVKF